jgi:hypothetical protein
MKQQTFDDSLGAIGMILLIIAAKVLIIGFGGKP